MRPFNYRPAQNPEDAVAQGAVQADAHVRAPVQYLAGGTTLIDLMKLDVMRPDTLVDIKRISDPAMHRIDVGAEGLRIGALASMAEAAENETIKRDYPVLSQSLWLAASQQLRIMATLGGNGAPAAIISAIPHTGTATSGTQVPDVLPSTASIASTPCLAPRMPASRPIRATGLKV